jgi:hypothetical protein
MDRCVFELSWTSCVSLFWPDAHLTRLKTIFDTYPQTIEHRGQTLINFKRYHKFRPEMMKLAQYKAPVVEFDPDTRSSLVYLEDQLNTVQRNNGIGIYIMERSQELEAEEIRLERLRIPQFRVAGFRG